MSPRSPRRGRRPLFTAAAALLAMTVLGVAAPAHADPLPAPAPTTAPAAPSGSAPDQPVQEPAAVTPTPGTDQPVATAVAEAQKTGRSVSIPSMTDEFSTTMASPDGTFATTYSVTPQRVQRDGRWTAIDTTLVERSDGTYAPAAAPADVSFGGGGSTALVSLKQGTHALKFTWAGKLPEPVITGDTATYPDVLPDVDLQVTANATGYSSIFVVRTAAAAANPKVQRLDLGLTATQVKVASTGDGGAEATDSRTGRAVFQANAAMMWDSTPSTADPADRATMNKALTSPQAAHDAAGLLGRNHARIKVGFSAGKQTLSLDQNLLAAKSTKYPVFVDPDWGVAYYGSQSSWARISSNGWNIYNSTATTGSVSARIGLDDWPQYGGEGEKAHTFYKMNIAGIKGAAVKGASLFVKHRWSAVCNTKTNAVVYATGAPAGFTSSTLNWGKEPSRGALLSTQAGTELNCGTSSPTASPGSFTFDVSANVTALAKSKKDYAYFLIEAQNMNDKSNWKQLGYKGGASLTVHYSYPPTVNADDGKQHLFPSVTDSGKTITTSRTPTLSWRATNRFPNGYSRPLMVDYHIEQKGTGKLIQVGYGPGPSTFNTYGSDFHVSTPLPDGDYQWRVTAKNMDGLWAPAWGPYKYFTVDATAPNPPTIKSSQFPPNQVGGGYTDKGVFALGNDRKNNVTGYLFTLDGDLNGVTSGGTKTPWTAGTTIVPGTVYYAKADNKDGTGTVVTNGSAAPVFAPRTAGVHTLRAKAVDMAGSTSGQTGYTFNAGTSTPIYVTGSKMISGYTLANTDGTTTIVPKATTTSAGGVLITQPSYAGYYFADGYQAMLANDSTTGTKVVSGDTATVSFGVPQLGIWEIGANLTMASDYGIYSLTLDQGTSTQSTITATAGFDAYATPNGTMYRNFLTPKDANDAPIVLDQGVHTLTLKVTGKNTAAGGYQAGIDMLRLSRSVTCPINDTRACLNNRSISTWNPSVTPPVTTADADGWGFSLNAQNLKDAGWAPGATVNVHGAPIKLPPTWGDGANDNILSSGQVVTVPASGVVNNGNAVVFAGFAVNGDVRDASGRINYAKNSGCNVASQAYTIDWMLDWAYVPAGSTVITLPWRNNTADGTAYAGPASSVMAASVPLVCPGAAVSSISLPLVSNTVDGHPNALHILGLGIRPGSGTADGARWVGSWSAAQDTSAIQTSGSANATLNTQTVRIPAHLSIGADSGRVRVRLANSQGKTPVTFDAASIALQDPGAGDATATDVPVPLTFNGARSVTLPAGTDLLSDPVTLAANDQATVLVSLKVESAPIALAGHLDAANPVYVSAPDNADHTGETGAAGFTPSTMTGLPYLAGVDVSTSATDPAGALVLYGDQTVNSDTTTADGLSHLSDQLTTALSSDEYGNRYQIRAGVLSQGSSSRGNGARLPTVPNSQYPQNSYGLIDREILTQSNAWIVLVSAGSSDLLACTGTAAACADTVNTKLNVLAGELQQYRPDDHLDYTVNLPTDDRKLKVYVATLPAFTSTHTAAQETARLLVNAHILGDGGQSNMEGHADGVIDFAAAVSADGTATGATVLPAYLSTGAPNALYYQSLAQQYVQDSDSVDALTGDGTVAGDDHDQPTAEWKFTEGSGPTAGDTGTGTPTNDPNDPTLNHPATLSPAAWADPGRQADRKAGTFNGTNSAADTTLPLNTAQSFTVSAWARLNTKTVSRPVFAQTGSGKASLYLQYDPATDCWQARMPSAASGDAITYFDADCNQETKAHLGVWTHLAVVYDASVNDLLLYVNGEPQGRADNVKPFTEPGNTARIGRSDTQSFAGDIADVRVWQRTLENAEIEGEASPRAPMVNWQFEEENPSPITAKDSSLRVPNAPGTFTGGVTWKTEGHPNPNSETDGTDADHGAITLNGTTGAVTTRARVRTDQSFTVAGWARATDTTRDQSVISQNGAHASGFQIGFGTSCKCWRLTLPATDATNPVTTTVTGPAATAGTWTHLAAVYDAATGTATLYVNGTAAPAQTIATRTWNATGLFTVGRVLRNDISTDYLAGDVDDVTAYQEALGADEIDNLRRTETPQG